MARTSPEIIAEIRKFQPDDGDWHRLDSLLDELWKSGTASDYVSDLFAVLERFPTEDGGGVLWSIVHSLEALPNYESELITSVRTKPSELTVAMLGRLLNAGVTHIGDTQLAPLLVEFTKDSSLPARVRAIASRFVPTHSA